MKIVLSDHHKLCDEEIADLTAQLAALREQIAGLTAALEPFARYADELLWGDRGVRDDVVLRWPYYGPPRVIVRRSDFKALRAASPAPTPAREAEQEVGGGRS